MIINNISRKENVLVTADIEKIEIFIADLTDPTTYTITEGAVDSYKHTINS